MRLPTSRSVRRFTLAAAAVAACATLRPWPDLSTALARQAAPTQPWRQYASPAEAGFDPAKLDAIGAAADAARSGAVMLVHRGIVVAAWGAVDRNFMAHSVRKSLAGALYGIAQAEGRLSLDATLASLGIDDEPALTPGERQARVRDLLAARSGVYHPAAYADASQDTARPARGSHPPGTFWFYNNWDFNTAEAIYEQVTGRDLYHAFTSSIAIPIGMEDWSAANGFEALEPGQSRMPAHTMRISTRDLARFGVLYLQRGRWNGSQVVPEAWIRESLTPHSDLGDGAGYGYLWWTYAPGSLGDKYPLANRLNIHVARGTGGQALFLLPAEDLVIVHRADTDHNRSVPGPQVWAMVEQTLAARTGTPAGRPALGPLKAAPLSSQVREDPAPVFLPLDARAMARYVGDYDTGEGPPVRVFVHLGRMFIEVPRQGVAELFAVGPDRFTIRVVPGVSITFSAEGGGAASGVSLVLGPQRIEGRRRDPDQAPDFDVEQVAPGVHVLVRRKPPGFLMDPNVTFIVNHDDVVVVDTNLTPASAEGSIRALRAITPRPVRTVINTHWHVDHTSGNQAYKREFPGVEFIAHRDARDDLAAGGAKNRSEMREQAVQFVAMLRGLLKDGKTLGGAPITPSERDGFEADIRLTDQLIAALPAVEIVVPGVVVDDQLVLQRGSRRIELRRLGRGHTRGDLIVWLPAERVAVTGDLVVGPTPLIGSDQSFIGDWARSLDALVALGPSVYVPGHGPVLRQPAPVLRLRDFLLALDRHAAAAIARGETLEQARATLKVDAFREAMAGEDPMLRLLFSSYGTGPGLAAAFRERTAAGS